MVVSGTVGFLPLLSDLPGVLGVQPPEVVETTGACLTAAHYSAAVMREGKAVRERVAVCDYPHERCAQDGGELFLRQAVDGGACQPSIVFSCFVLIPCFPYLWIQSFAFAGCLRCVWRCSCDVVMHYRDLLEVPPTSSSS